jgi:Sec-independent protein translocase protein TatA
VNFLGIGLPEIALIMVVGFLVLGPAKTIEMARTTGKVWREIKNTVSDVTAAASLDDTGRDDVDRRPGPPNPTGPGPREDPPRPGSS